MKSKITTETSGRGSGSVFWDKLDHKLNRITLFPRERVGPERRARRYSYESLWPVWFWNEPVTWDPTEEPPEPSDVLWTHTEVSVFFGPNDHGKLIVFCSFRSTRVRSNWTVVWKRSEVWRAVVVWRFGRIQELMGPRPPTSLLVQFYISSLPQNQSSSLHSMIGPTELVWRWPRPPAGIHFILLSSSSFSHAASEGASQQLLTEDNTCINFR